jgi:periplasmic divalent cation tolerance protein
MALIQHQPLQPGQNVVVLVTISSQEQAKSIARLLVEEKLVACVNIIPQLTSFYIWQNQLEEETEALMILKTSTERLPALEERLVALHPYECAEFIALPIVAGSERYLGWVRAAVHPTEGLI